MVLTWIIASPIQLCPTQQVKAELFNTESIELIVSFVMGIIYDCICFAILFQISYNKYIALKCYVN